MMNNNDFFGQQSPFGENPFGQGPFGNQPPKKNWKEQLRQFRDKKKNHKKPQEKTKASRIVLTAVLFVLQLLVQFYVSLPAINIQSTGFWAFAGENLLILMVLTSALCRGSFASNLRRVCTAVIGVGVVAFFALALLSSPILQSHQYASLMQDSIEQKQIEEYTPTIDNVPLLDKDSASRLANRALGNLVDEVSQFELYDTYQVTVAGAPVRVQPLDYVGFVKWFMNRSTGIPAYITVDMKT